MILHSFIASNVAVLADNVSVAVTVPVSVLLAVNVVLPHPRMVGVANEPEKWKSGSNSIILSGVAPASRGVLRANTKVSCDGAPVKGVKQSRRLCWNTGVGAATSVDTYMDPGTGARLVAEAKVIPTIRIFVLATCALGLVVTPLPTVTVHSMPAARVAVAVLNSSVASDVPEPVAFALNVVLPHPADELGVANVPRVKVGSINAMTSVVCSRLVVSANVNAIEDGVHV